MRIRYSFGSRHTGRIKNIKKQRGKYPDVVREVVRISDIVLEVLDARFVEETRNLEVEKDVLKQGKKLIYVLNKADLIGRVGGRWQVEGELPDDLTPRVFVSVKSKMGARDLRNRIKIEASRILKKFDGNRQQAIGDGEGFRRVHVGIVGYPNVGKSSLINLLGRRGAAMTSAKAGFTRGMQKIRMSEGILILDTPGVIPTSEYSTEVGSFAKDVKVGARSYDDVKNPEDVVFYLMTAPTPKDEENVSVAEKKAIKEAEINSKKIEKFYGVDAGGDSEVLIEELGKAKGFLGKGGKVDVDRSARLVLRDWQEGKIGKD